MVLFVAMPSRRMPNGEFKDIAHPIKPELRSEITDSVIEKI
jgi:stage V sporulation protein G